MAHPYSLPSGDASVRKLATFIPVEDLADTDITPYIESADDIIDTETGRVGTYWSSGEEEYGEITLISKYLAASFLIDHYGPLYIGAMEAQRNADSKFAKGMELLKRFVEKHPTPATDVEVTTASSSYSTFEAANMEDPGQTTVLPYRSTDFV